MHNTAFLVVSKQKHDKNLYATVNVCLSGVYSNLFSEFAFFKMSIYADMMQMDIFSCRRHARDKKFS